MKKIPEVLVREMRREMDARKIPRTDQVEAFKWLRYYLDFCHKYDHSTRDPETALLFVQKLSSKGQSEAQQRRAGECITLFREVAQRFPAKGKEQLQAEELTDWGVTLVNLEQVFALRQCAKSTRKNYRHWVIQFQDFLKSKPVEGVSDDDAVAFLSWLATHRNVVATTQNQAFNALLFFFRHVLKRPYDLKDRVQRARRTRYVPVVLSRQEVEEVFSRMEDPYLLIAQLLYGCGLRLTETLRLRVGQLDLAHHILTIHRGKGRKDRAMPLPEGLLPKLTGHLEKVRVQFDADVAAGFGGSFAPEGSPVRWETRCKQWPWQFVFPAKTFTLVPDSGVKKRYHVHDTQFSKALRHAVWKSGINKRVGAHTLRHTFASHLLLAGYDIRTIQEMMGHADVKTAMIYTQTVPSRTLANRKSPLDLDVGLLTAKSA